MYLQGAAIATFYVSDTGNDDWSGQISSPNEQKSDGPLRTIEFACKLARRGNDKTVQVRAGTHFIKGPLQLGVQDSGLQLTNFPGEHPVISGGLEVTDWRQERPGIWSAALPQSAQRPVRLLRDGEHFLPVTRFPHLVPGNALGGWLIADTPDHPSNDQLQARPGDLKKWHTVSDLELVIFPDAGWMNEILTVTSIDETTSLIEVDTTRNTQKPIVAGNRYHLRNMLEEINQKGSWCFVKDSDRIWVNPRTGTEMPKNIIIPGCLGLIELKGNYVEFVENITITGFEFRDTGYSETFSQYCIPDAGILLSAARNCQIADNKFLTLGGYAIKLQDRSENNEIVHNSIEEVGGGGILFKGKTNTHPRSNTIAHNLIRRCGYVSKHVAGVYCDSAEQSTIFHNKIVDMPRYGVTFQNHPNSANLNNKVDQNEILNTSLETKDSAAIDFFSSAGQDSHDIVSGNLIKNTGGLTTDRKGTLQWPFMTWGVYLDNCASGVTVEGNVLQNCPWGGVFIHGGSNNTVTNNVFMDNPTQQVMTEGFQNLNNLANNVFINNIAIFPSNKSSLQFNKGEWNPFTWRTFDKNMYWKTFAGDFFANQNLTPLGNLTQWRAKGFDRQSIIADPQLKEYRYQSRTAAAKIGIKKFGGTDMPSEPFGARPR